LGCLKTEAQFSFLKRVQCDLFQGYLFSKALDIDTLITKVTEQRYKFLPEQIITQEFFLQVKSMYPNTVRMILSGYTDLKSVTDSINRDSIYKFLTKPWDDNLLRQEIANAFKEAHQNKLNNSQT